MTFFEWFYKNLIVQGIFVLIVLLSVIVMKYFVPKTFSDVKNFYQTHFTTDTSVSEVVANEI